ncbi:cyclic AMP-responsive element-binding protein 3-like protein 2 isoform X2 [Ambystoma mexicanum]
MMDVDLSPSSPSPLIQAEHSYSLCGDSRPQSPLTQGTPEDFNEDMASGEWCLSADRPPVKIKEEEPILCKTPGLAPSVTLNIGMPSAPLQSVEIQQLPTDAMMKVLGQSAHPQIKLEPHEVDQFLNLCPKEEALHLPPTPPSSHSSDSDGSQSPSRSLPPSSPSHSQVGGKLVARNPSALSNSPLLTAPHKLQGTGPLLLTEEEKRTLIAEGYPIPNKLPLTKAEEKALKKIRRKIKNKISAQESRRKKKEYMDTLEKKVETCSTENCELRKKVEVLESTNRTLLQQLQRLQSMVAGKVARSCKVASTQTGTCLMVVVLCFAVAFGSFSQNYGPYPSATKTVLSSQHSPLESYTASIVRSRNLLIYEEQRQRDEHHSQKGPADVWDGHVDQPLHAPSLQESHLGGLDTEPTFVISNETQLEKSILLELQHHRMGPDLGLNETLKIIGIDQRVNATS